MANSISAMFPTYWSNRMQKVLKNSLVSFELANREEEAKLRNGNTVNRIKFTVGYVQDYVRGTEVQIQNLGTTNQSLVIDQEKTMAHYIDKFDTIQAVYDFGRFIDLEMYKMRDYIDGQFLRQCALYANLDLDDGDFGGTDGQPKLLTKSNVLDFISTSQAVLLANNVETTEPWCIVISPAVANYIQQAVSANGFQLADYTLKNGYNGMFLGYRVYISNNLPHVTTITYTGQPTATNSLYIGDVTLTFVASPTATGDVDIGADADGSYANLVAAINKTGTAGTDYVIDLDPTRNKLMSYNAYAVQDTSAGTVKIYTAGYQNVGVNTLANASIGDTDYYMYSGQKGAIDLVMQSNVNIQFNKEPKQTGYTHLLSTLYGMKTFDEGAERMCKLFVKK